MTVQFEADVRKIEELHEKMKRLPNSMEKDLNKSLHTEGAKIAAEEITNQLPVSNWKGRIRPKNHAKNSNWHKVEKENLGFNLKTKGGAAKNAGSFGYLVFPDEGRGPFNPFEQGFMQKGLDIAIPRILDKLIQVADRRIEEDLG